MIDMNTDKLAQELKELIITALNTTGIEYTCRNPETGEVKRYLLKAANNH